MTWNQCSAELHAAGYVHAHGNSFAKVRTDGRRGVTWAKIECGDNGLHWIKWPETKS